ncbi:MAG: transporter substrate-binding domain-containing protein [Oceanospirillaceae bacterium]|nr:transporter substrate-binding domain-containing protein [Oceanospirillaceae bacterium]
MNTVYLFVIFFTSFLIQPCFAVEKMTVALVGVHINGPVFRIANEVLQQIAKKMDVKIELKALPASRAALLLSRGSIHADFSRIPSFSLSNPTAIRVKEPVTEISWYAYSLLDDMKITGWESLKPYKIVIVRGLVFKEKYLKNYNVHVVNTLKQAVKYLLVNRADILISNPLSIGNLSVFRYRNGSSIQKSTHPLVKTKTYTFFSSHYPVLARKFNEALIEVKKEHVYRQLDDLTK